MKQVTLIGGKTIEVSDKEAGGIKATASRGGFVELLDGTLLNTSSISIMTDVAKKEYWWGNEVYTMPNGAKYIIRDGKNCFLETHNLKEIEKKSYDETAMLQESI